MAEYAKKEVLIEKLLEIANDFEQHGGLMDVAFAVATNELAEMLKDKDCGIFEEAKPVVHAHWFLLDDCANEGVYCSACTKKVYKTNYAEQKLKSKYCPNCGAQMDEEFASDKNVGSKTEGVKIPVISMEDVPKLAKEMEK